MDGSSGSLAARLLRHSFASPLKSSLSMLCEAKFPSIIRLKPALFLRGPEDAIKSRRSRDHSCHPSD